MANIAKLYELQKIDATSTKIRRRLGQLKQLLTESDEVKAARSQATSLEDAQREWHGKQKSAELEVQSLTSRIQESESRLMGGQVRNPKELESLQSSIEALQRQRSALETASVEALLKTEELTSQLAGAHQQFQTVQQAWSSSQTELTEEELKLKRAYLHLKKQREALTTTLEQTLLQQYEHMRERKNGIAVAAVTSGNCTACNVKVPSGVLSTLRSQPDKLLTCPTCGRILYAP
ncbi:MAG: hypothetical protein KF832_14735 [Caldilineaceae bacterium]|nr:hypothetical protein [Caldilineaceae bacterium]